MVSFVIPTYNRKDVVMRTVKSALDQTYRDIEAIVIDDGSTDGTERLFSGGVDGRIRYERLRENQGVHAARNRGIELASGEFIVFIDSDDELYPVAVEMALKIFKEDSNIGVVSAPFVTDSGERTSFTYERSRVVAYEDMLCGRNQREKKTGLTIVRRSCIGDTRFAEQNLDFIFYRKLAKKTKFFFINEPLGIYNLSEDQSSLHVNRRIPNVERSKKRAVALADFVDEFYDDFMRCCPQNVSTYAYGASVGLLLQNVRERSKKYARICWMHQKMNIKYLLFFLFTFIPFSPKILYALFGLRRRLSFRT